MPDPAPNLLKVAIVSTWRQFCGIATYSRDLARALIKFGHHVVVLAEEGVSPDTANEDGFDAPYLECWRRDITGYGALIKIIEQERPDIIHVQHEYGLFPDTAAFAVLIETLRRHAHVVVTMHTISGHDRGLGPDHDRKAAFSADAAVVHSWTALDALGRPIGRQIPVVHIPHGTREGCRRMDRDPARAQLGILQDAFAVASVGFIGREKRFEDVGLAVVKTMAHIQNIAWIAGGRSTSDKFERIRAWVEGREALCRRAVLYGRYLSDDDYDVVFGAADVVVFNSNPTPHSTSGQLHLALAYGMPVVAARVALYDDADACGERFDGAVELAKVLTRLGLERDRLGGMAARSAEVARITAWSRIAAMHDQLYRRVLAEDFRFVVEDDVGWRPDPNAAPTPIGLRPTAKVIS